MKSIVMVEDHPALAQALALALNSQGIATVEVFTPDNPDAFDAVADRTRDLALLDLDLGMDRGAGVDYLRHAVRHGVPSAMFTGSTDEATLGRCLAEGARGVIAKRLAFDDVVTAVSKLLEGGMVNDDASRLRWIMAHQQRSQELEPFRNLSKREQAVLAHLIDGRRVDEIADLDFVSIATVRSQVRAVLQKLDANSQIQAVALAVKARWAPDPVDQLR